MSYVDGAVIAVPTVNKDAYIEMASKMAVLFKKHGALNVVETWGNDVPQGKITSFPMAVQCKPDETVVFSWIFWPDAETRKIGFPKAMEESMTAHKDDPMPFDGKRMIFGGFDVVLNA